VKKYISYGKDKSIKVISTSDFELVDSKGHVAKTDDPISLYQKFIKKEDKDTPIKIGYICNWNQQCGISTYSKFIFDELKSLVDEYKIFSELPFDQEEDTKENIVYCWRRGEHLKKLLNEIKEYNPNFILIQHEWGIFPKAGFFMSFITELKRLHIPVIVALHSVYDHLDKIIPLSVLDNVIVHSSNAKGLLERLKFKGNVFVIPHGCPEVKKYEEVWNIFQTPYLIFGFGFGFKYKGVDIAIDAIKYLKETDEKFKDILYVYVCSESDTNKGIHEYYYNTLSEKVEKEGLEDNVLLIRGFLEDEMLDVYLKTVKMVIFPYISDPTNSVFGSSGAIKIAMSYNMPVIASKSHLFDDIEGYAIRIGDYKELATEIDKLFSSEDYRKQFIDKAHDYIEENTWKKSAERYFNVIKEVRSLY
jgi:glycosyltransferase involved in cell wall biosynthesis